jgi:hypothetical protein
MGTVQSAYKSNIRSGGVISGVISTQLNRPVQTDL